jgi:hypothetical protein
VTPSDAWPGREEREQWEAEAFLEHYRKLSGARDLEFAARHERPDVLLRDATSGDLVGLELTTVYLDDRSVPDVHKRPDDILPVPFWPEEVLAYGARVADAVHRKANLARTGYTMLPTMILSVHVNEYVTVHMTEADW